MLATAQLNNDPVSKEVFAISQQGSCLREGQVATEIPKLKRLIETIQRDAPTLLQNESTKELVVINPALNQDWLSEVSVIYQNRESFKLYFVEGKLKRAESVGVDAPLIIMFDSPSCLGVDQLDGKQDAANKEVIFTWLLFSPSKEFDALRIPGPQHWKKLALPHDKMPRTLRCGLDGLIRSVARE